MLDGMPEVSHIVERTVINGCHHIPGLQSGLSGDFGLVHLQGEDASVALQIKTRRHAWRDRQRNQSQVRPFDGSRAIIDAIGEVMASMAMA